MATNKDKILRAASELIHRNGYEKTSVEMLLSESEVSKSNFYYHFDSKEALCLKVINLWIDDYEKRIFHDILSNSSLTPSERIKSLYDNHKAMLRNFEGIFGCPFGNLAVETSRSGDSFRSPLSSFFSEWQKPSTECIYTGIQCGEFRNDLAPKLIAGLILCHLEGALMMAKLHMSLEHLTLGAWTILKLINASDKTG